MMVEYVIPDTHALAWYFADDPSLGSNALTILESLSEKKVLAVPTIVLAELMYIAKKGRIDLNFSETLNLIDTHSHITIVPLDKKILITADALSCNLEMHDRLIVATTMVLDGLLLTKDAMIVDSGLCNIEW